MVTCTQVPHFQSVPGEEMKNGREKNITTVIAMPEHRQDRERVVMADTPDGYGMNEMYFT